MKQQCFNILDIGVLTTSLLWQK